jgi:hypothetical protein
MQMADNIRYLVEQDKKRDAREKQVENLLQTIKSMLDKFGVINPYDNDGAPAIIMKKEVGFFINILEDLIQKGKVWDLAKKNDLEVMFRLIRYG